MALIDVEGGLHIDGKKESVIGECGTCHDVPPATGSHLAHYGASVIGAVYGDTGDTAALLPGGGDYAFGCGNCHPVEESHHMNGVKNTGGGFAEVDLSPAGVPQGSLKAMNRFDAAYTPGLDVFTDSDGLEYTLGTCSGVYCHSRATYQTPDPIQIPGTDFPFTGYPIDYPFYTVLKDREFESPAWGGNLSCDGCHGFPPRTFHPGVQAGAGDSHSWIDGKGHENLHGWNHGGAPEACSTCHFGTVSEAGARTRDPATGWSVYGAVPVSGYLQHVNGVTDVEFPQGKIKGVDGEDFDLTGASWAPDAATCSDVACHLNQTSVEWGLPFRRNVPAECLGCHGNED
ncbi:MAG: CxxxxCH/CxxCH domain-containing protein [Deltaproteobacteria bacterium]|nr:CxxxxCH/CxxCH domain-containing protein [Deltaproteobacteria bacterium]